MDGIQANCKCKPLKHITHLIFDLDGTLLDSEVHYNQAHAEICAEFGAKYTLQEEMKILGVPSLTMARILIDCLNLPTTVEQYVDKYHQISNDLIKDSKLMPGVEKLINHFYKYSIPMAIATSSSDATFHIKMQKHKEFLKMFNHYVLTTDPEVRRGKPFPDIFLTTRRRFREAPKAENCLVFEDSPNGIKAAKAANMPCVLIPDPKVPQELRKGATMVIKSLEDFDPEAFGLPPF